MAPTREQRMALAQGGMDSFSQGDMKGMLGALTEDVEVYAAPEMVNAGHFRGHQEFVSWIMAWTDAWEEVTADVTDNQPIGERHVVISIHQDGRGRGGIEVNMDLAFVFEVNDEGKCPYLAMVPTPEEALRI